MRRPDRYVVLLVIVLVAVAVLARRLPVLAPRTAGRAPTPRAAGPSSPATPTAWWATVASTIDGDTIEIVRDGRTRRARLYGIDCPEGDQRFGEEARAFTQRLVSSARVRIVPRDTDSYGRLVVEVRTADGKRVSAELVAAGLAWWYRHYAPDDVQLRDLEAQARAAHRGLWADPNPVPPWTWRKR